LLCDNCWDKLPYHVQRRCTPDEILKQQDLDMIRKLRNQTNQQ